MIERVKTDMRTSVDDIYERDAIVIHKDYVTSIDLVAEDGTIVARLNMVHVGGSEYTVDLIPIHPTVGLHLLSWKNGERIMNNDLPVGSMINVSFGWRVRKETTKEWVEDFINSESLKQAPDAHLEEDYENRTHSDLD